MTDHDMIRIQQLAQDLAHPREDIEQAFVFVGTQLTQAAALLNTLSKLFEALPAALQGAEVEAAVGHLEAVATRAATLSKTFAQEKADLARLVEVVDAASSPISDLNRTVKMMGIVSVNARVTAAGIVGDSDDFDVFTTDIAALSDSASRTIQEFSLVYRQLTAEVDRAASQRARFESAHASTLSGLSESLGQTIGALSQQRLAAAQSSIETSQISRQIVGRIGNAVMALQVGDATRQRIEHVETALATLAQAISQTAPDGSDRSAALAAFAVLEQGQLSETAASFAQEIGEAQDALVALASDAGTILSRSRDFLGHEGGSAIAQLSAQLRAAVTILTDFEIERGKLEAVAGAVQQTVGVLLGHVAAVQEIESNMRLVSLNAAVRCAQLGPRGASLTVIAQQLRELTGETVIAAQTAMSRLDQSSALAGAFAAAGGETSSVGALEQQASLALDILVKLDTHIGAALGKLNGDGPKVIDLLRNAAQGLSGQSALAEALDDAALAVAGLSTDPLPDELSPVLATLLETVRKTYTMEAERQVHARLFGHIMSVAPANENAAAAEDDLADFML